ncbi:MAG: hypothetical protein KGO50_13335 [Myxococcales bacterium]|nr:hypothetical protein [Myxococcales bacterium]
MNSRLAWRALLLWGALSGIAPAALAQSPPDPSQGPDRQGPEIRSGRFVERQQFGLYVSGFVQTQYQSSQLSEDELQQGGGTLNRDRFVVRRARIRMDYDAPNAVAQLEVDGNTVRGASMSIRRANAGLVLRNPADVTSPLIRLRVGLTEIPFGYELRMGQDALFFLERSEGSWEMVPGPTDVGVRLDGELGAFRYDLGISNGTPVSDQSGTSGADPTRAPDLAARFGAEGQIAGRLTVSGGASILTGTGFSAGSEAEKPRVEWRDLNENESLDTGELIAVPGRGAVPSEIFHRWAVGADLQLALKTPIGNTRVFGEVVMATNMARGTFVSDPVLNGADLRQTSAWVAVAQDLWNIVELGVRYDFANPDDDFLDARRGFRVPQSAATRTISPLVGLRLREFGRLLFQYDFITDTLARDTRGVPVDARNNQWFVRLQGNF